MDPYLEARGIWEQVHTRLIVAIADWLGPQIRPKYRVDIELRTYRETGFISTRSGFVGMPDVVVKSQPPDKALHEAAQTYDTGLLIVPVQLPQTYEVRERYLQVRSVDSGEAITAIELLSPTNKTPGKGRDEYEDKRDQILASRTHLIEIDLLRSGERMPMAIHNAQLLDYYILISRATQRPRGEVCTFALRQPIPSFPVPLLNGDHEPVVPLNQLLHEVYNRAGYDLAIDYTKPCAPPLSPQDAEWATSLLKPVTSQKSS
jgi:hypothetical protein